MVVPSHPVCLPQYSASPTPEPLHTLCVSSDALNPQIQVLLLTPMALRGLISLATHIFHNKGMPGFPVLTGLYLYLLILHKNLLH